MEGYARDEDHYSIALSFCAYLARLGPIAAEHHQCSSTRMRISVKQRHDQ